MIEERKKKEISFYDQKSIAWLESSGKKWDTDFEAFSPFLLSSYQFLQEYLKDKCQGKRILDYGCGNGVHSFWLESYGAEVVGIDLSEKSLDIAKERARKTNSRATFVVGDCEKMEFADNSFDIIFDGGTFSSLDISKAYPELKRVLKPTGFLIGIETLGHNPITNLKRYLNELFGKRTGWAASHIFKLQNYQDAKKYFAKTEIYFFHPMSWLVFPFLKIKQFYVLLRALDKIDKLLLKIKLLQKYSFKVVFVYHDKKTV